MGFLSKTLKRAESGEPRVEDNLTTEIAVFMKNHNVNSYKITNNKEWIVDIDGSLHIEQSDLDKNGELFFKIGRLTGNLYFHGKYFKPTVIPAELGGDVIFVQEETDSRSQKGNNKEEDDNLDMGLLTTKSRAQVVKQLETALTESLANGYDIDVQEILSRLSEDWKNRDKYMLRIEFPEKDKSRGAYNPSEYDKFKCVFYVSPDGKPLDLSAIETAVYILYILHPEGLPLMLGKGEVRLLKKIYKKLIDAVPDEVNGLLGMDDFIKDTTINRYRHDLRKEIQKHISNSKIVDEFAIEGYRDEPFKVQKATDEMRAEIREKFGLD